MQHPRQFVHYEFQLGGEDAQISRIVQSCEVAEGGGGVAKLCAKSAAQPWWLLLKEEEFENKFCKQWCHSKSLSTLVENLKKNQILVESLKCKIVAVS